jgi:3-oxoacyl-[acyl-carrier protein] reductase
MQKSRTTVNGDISIVVGAASGIGRATALLLSERGATVVLLDVNGAGINNLAAEIKSNGGKATAKVIDMSDHANISSVVKEISEEFGKIDSLVNTVGITGPTGVNVEDISWPEFHKTLTINLFGAIWITQEVLHVMKPLKYGRIAQITSIAGKEGNPGMAPYNTSKAGLIGFVKGVSKEVAQFGILINAVAPAVIRTPINENTAKETLAYMLSKIPMGRMGEVEEVAEMIAFMVSPKCSFTTGFTFDASGGRATY